MRFGPVVLSLAFGSAPALLPAQPGDSAATTPRAPPRSTSCFRGRPEPICHSFWLTEFGLAQQVGALRRNTMFQVELGGMVNHGTRRAFGLAAFAQGADEGSGIGIRPRVRTWLGPTTSLDIAPGVFVRGSRGFSGQVSLNYADYAAITSNVTVMPGRGDNEGTRVMLHVGAKLGSRPGVIAAIATPLIALIVLAIACGNGGCNWGL